MIYLANIVLLFALAASGFWLSRKSALRPWYWPALGLKLAAGVAVGLLYSAYYGHGDSWAMFAEAGKLKQAAFVSLGNFIRIYFDGAYNLIPGYAYTFQPRAALMTKLLAPLNLITGENYWLTSAYLSLFAFAGLWFFANTLYKAGQMKWLAVIPALFFPSIVFWSSGVLKESLAIGALAAVFAVVIRVYFSGKVGKINLLVCMPALLLVVYLKYYLAAVLVVAVLALFIARAVLPAKAAWHLELITIIAVFVALAGVASLSHPNFWPSRFLQVLAGNYYQYVQNSPAGNVVVFGNLEPTVSSFLRHSPRALVTGLFGPLWLPGINTLKLFSLAESWLLLLAFIYAVLNFQLPAGRNGRLLLWACLLLVVTAAVFITFAAPNYGTLARYRIGYSLVFVSLISYGIARKFSRR